MDRDTCRDPDRGGALSRIRSGEHLVGQPRRGRAVPGQRERVGELGTELGRPGVGGRAVQPGRLRRLVAVACGQVGQRQVEDLLVGQVQDLRLPRAAERGAQRDRVAILVFAKRFRTDREGEAVQLREDLC